MRQANPIKSRLPAIFTDLLLVSLLPLWHTRPLKIGEKGLHHPVHTTHAHARSHWSSRFIFFLFYNNTISSENHRSDRSGILESGFCNLSWVNNACCEKVFVAISFSVIAKAVFTFFNLVCHNRTFEACVGNNLAERFFNSATDNRSTCLLICIFVRKSVNSIGSTDKSNTTASNDTFFNSSAGSV